jgi:hypothetical protein
VVIAFYVGVLLVLTGNHVFAYFPIIDDYYGFTKIVIHNLVRFAIYILVGYASVVYFSFGKKHLFLVCIAIFFFEQVVLKIIQLRVAEYRELGIVEFFQQVQGFDILLLSFLLFSPIVILLSYLGVLIARRKTTLRANNNNVQ